MFQNLPVNFPSCNYISRDLTLDTKEVKALPAFLHDGRVQMETSLQSF